MWQESLRPAAYICVQDSSHRTYPAICDLTYCKTACHRDWLSSEKRFTTISPLRRSITIQTTTKACANPRSSDPRTGIFVNRPPIAVIKVGASIMNKPTCKKFMRGSFGPFRIIGMQQHTLTIDENGVPNTISVYRGMHAPPINTNSPKLYGENEQQLGKVKTPNVVISDKAENSD